MLKFTVWVSKAQGSLQPPTAFKESVWLFTQFWKSGKKDKNPFWWTACESGLGWQTGLSKIKAHDRLSSSALVQCVFAKCMVVFPSPCKEVVSPHWISNRRSGDSCLVNHGLKSSMLSLQGTHAAGHCSLFDLQPVPSGITLDVQLLHMAQRTCHHKTGGPETRKVQIIPLPNQYTHCTSLITGSQIYKPCAGDRNVFNYTWSPDCQVASCSQISLVWFFPLPQIHLWSC